MTRVTPNQTERLIAYAVIAPGCLVSAILALNDALFLPNFAFYWGGQLAVLSVIFLMRPRPAVLAAMAIVLAALLLCLQRWIAARSGSHPDGLVWLLYPVLLSGAAVGGMGAAWWLSVGSSTGWRIAWITGTAALSGTCLSAAVACSTVFYCR